MSASILIFHNKNDFISESLQKIALEKKSSKIVLVSIEELMINSTVVHQFFDSNKPSTTIKRSNGEEINPDSFDLIFNRINNFVCPTFVSRKDAGYSYMEWFALINSVYYSLGKKTVNYNIQMLLNNYTINPLLLFNLCKKHKIKFSALDISNFIKQETETLVPTRILFLKNQFAGDISQPLKEKIISLAEDIRIDFAEIFFTKESLASVNPFPVCYNEKDMDFIYQTLTALI